MHVSPRERCALPYKALSSGYPVACDRDASVGGHEDTVGVADLARGPAMKKSVHRLWSSADSGLVVPRGYHVGTVKSSSQARLQVEEKAKALERLYISAKVRLPKKSDLSRLIVEAKTFAQLPLTDKTKLFRMLNFDRIADSVLQLEGEPSRVKFLKALVSGSLNLLDRNKSMAKDML